MRSTLDIWQEEMKLIRARQRRDRIAAAVVFAADCAGFIVFVAYCIGVSTSGHP